MIRPMLLLCLICSTLAAVEAATVRDALDAATWIRGSAPVTESGPVLVLLFATEAPESAETLVTVADQASDADCAAAALSADPAETLTTFLAPLGAEAGIPVGRLDAARIAALAADARGLPHCLLLTANGTLAWQGHPRLSASAMGTLTP